MPRPLPYFVAICVFATSVGIKAFTLEGTVFDQIGREASIRPELLYAVALTESGFSPTEASSSTAPYPWVIRTPNTAFYEKSREAAEHRLREVLRRHSSVDVGLMQINLRWHGSKVSDPIELLNPETNLRIAADILNTNFRRFPNDAFRAVGLYPSYSKDKRLKYAKRVFRIYNRIIDLSVKSFHCNK